MNFTLDSETLLIFSLILNIGLIIFYVIKGPRKPRDAEEAMTAIENVSVVLDYDLITLQCGPDAPIGFLLTPPEHTQVYVKKLNDGGPNHGASQPRIDIDKAN